MTLEERNKQLIEENLYLTYTLSRILSELKTLSEKQREFPLRYKVIENEEFTEWMKLNNLL